jgi:hypothetical protein
MEVGRDLRGGLRRCIDLLVATMRKDAAGGVVFGGGDGGMGEEEVSLLLGGGERRGGAGEGVEEVEPVLMRALCEVVRCAEERF